MFLVKRSRLLVLEITILFIKCTKNNMCHLPHLYIIEVCGYFKRYLTPYIASVSLLVTVFFHAILLTNLIILVTRNKLVFVHLLTYFASKSQCPRMCDCTRCICMTLYHLNHELKIWNIFYHVLLFHYCTKISKINFKIIYTLMQLMEIKPI